MRTQPRSARCRRRPSYLNLAPPSRAFASLCAPLRSASKQTRRKVFPCINSRNNPPFELGQVVATPGALAALEKAGQGPFEFLTRHVNQDWGDVSSKDKRENDYSLEHGFRLLSSYRTNAGDRLWIITEADRSATTLLLPEES